MVQRNESSHRWNGYRKGAENQGICLPKSDSVVMWSMDAKPKNERIAVIYRVSNSQSTTENQKFGLDLHVRSLPYDPSIIDITASNWKRPIKELEQLVSDIKAAKLDEVHFWAVDRTGRKHDWDVAFWNTCVKHNVLLWYIGDDLRSDRPKDRTKFYRKSVDAEEERDQISERTKLSFSRRKAAYVLKHFPERNQELQAAMDKDRELKIYENVNKVYVECYNARKGQGYQDRPIGGGKEKGCLHHKTRKLIPAIQAMLTAGHSKRFVAATFNISQHTVIAVSRR